MEKRVVIVERYKFIDLRSPLNSRQKWEKQNKNRNKTKTISASQSVLQTKDKQNLKSSQGKNILNTEEYLNFCSSETGNIRRQ